MMTSSYVSQYESGDSEGCLVAAGFIVCCVELKFNPRWSPGPTISRI